MRKSISTIKEGVEGTNKGDIVKVKKGVFKSPFDIGTLWVCDGTRKTNVPGESEVMFIQLDKQGNKTKQLGTLFTSLIDVGVQLGAFENVPKDLEGKW